MKKYIIFLLLYSCSSVGQSSNADDYILLNSVLKHLTHTNGSETLYIDGQPLGFEAFRQDEIFTKPFFLNLTHPTIGVDTIKVKAIVDKLDYDFLAKQIRENERWDFSKLQYKIIDYSQSKNENLKGQKKFQISKPIYSADKKIAFIQFSVNDGNPYSYSTSMNIYILEKGNWQYYASLPLAIS
jgi:hypothetical protein